MKNLIEALRETADGIESGGLVYDWSSHATCNCGLLARTALGFTEAQLREQMFLGDCSPGTWKDRAKRVCPLTGEPLNKVFAKLLLIGLNPIDIGQLEHCSNPAVLSSMADAVELILVDDILSHPNRSKPAFVTRYMRAWADILEEEQTAKLEAVELRELKPFSRNVGISQPRETAVVSTQIP